MTAGQGSLWPWRARKCKYYTHNCMLKGGDLSGWRNPVARAGAANILWWTFSVTSPRCDQNAESYACSQKKHKTFNQRAYQEHFFCVYIYIGILTCTCAAPNGILLLVLAHTMLFSRASKLSVWRLISIFIFMVLYSSCLNKKWNALWLMDR